MIKNILLVVLSAITVVLAGFGYSMVDAPADTLPADVNADGVTNLQDVSIVMSQMSTTSSTSTSAE